MVAKSVSVESGYDAPPISGAHSQLLDIVENLWHYDSVLFPDLAPATPLGDHSLLEDLQARYPVSDHGVTSSSPKAEDAASTASDTPADWQTHYLYPVFTLMDENKDGEVSSDEISRLLRKLGMEISPGCLVSLMGSVDTNRDMSIDFREFVTIYESVCSDTLESENASTRMKIEVEEHSQDLLDSFRVYDRNRDGYISADELALVLRDLGLQEAMHLDACQRMINQVDSDGNGLVDFDEFKVMMGRGRCGVSNRSTFEIGGTVLVM